MTIKLIVLDVDGVISVGETHPFSPDLFRRLANLNRRARQGELLPAVTLNTGRPSPYVEAVMQAIDGWQPALYETGAGMYLPVTYQFKASPWLTPAHQALLRRAVEQLDESLVRPGRAYWQPGKSVCYSLLAEPPFEVPELLAQAQAVIAAISDELVVSRAGVTVNIYPAGINKGTGLEWLARTVGLEPAEMAGVGDSKADLDFLRHVGWPAAPANAIQEVRAEVRYVSPYPDAAGLMDILDQWGMP